MEPAARTRTRSRRVRKQRGQHFLERPWVERVIGAIAPAPGDVFLEIGPGRGALTRPLASKAAHVIAFEIDRELIAELTASRPSNLTIVPGDFLRVTADRVRHELAAVDLPARPLRVAGNLPYRVASPILFKLLELFDADLGLTDAVVMLQREVADRLTAAPGTRDYGVLSVRIGHHAGVVPLLELPPGAFRPPPLVRSTLVRLDFHPASPPPDDPSTFAALTQLIFTRRRKTLANALLAYLPAKQLSAAVLSEAGIDGTRRPETLGIPELVRIANVIARVRRA
jgi:16S rRNA (adenine1518-N6/adenine1519-N6)-dimethyltransferase